VQRCRNEMQRADAGRRAQDQETGLSDQRRGHIEAEYEMYLRKEQLRIDFVNESQTMHRNAMDEVEKAIAEVNQTRQRTLLEKEAIEQEIDRCNEAMNKFQVRTLCLRACANTYLSFTTFLHCCNECRGLRDAVGMCLCDRAWAGTGQAAAAARRRVPRQALRHAREVH
jgi:hypothetical protein